MVGVLENWDGAGATAVAMTTTKIGLLSKVMAA